MTPSCQITQNGGWPSHTSDQIRKPPTGCAILKSQTSVSPHQKVRRPPGLQIGRLLLLFPLLLPPSSVPLGVGFQRRALPRPSSPWEGFPKGKAPKRRRGRIKRGAFEEMARLAAHQGRESYSHDGVRAAARPFVSFQGGAGGNRNSPRVSL